MVGGSFINIYCKAGMFFAGNPECVRCPVSQVEAILLQLEAR